MQTWLVRPGCGVWRDETGVRPVFRIIIFFGIVYGVISGAWTSAWFFIHLFYVFKYILGHTQLKLHRYPSGRGCILVFTEFLGNSSFFLAVLITTKIMAMLEGRSFWSYNLGLFRCWIKLFFGFLMGILSMAVALGIMLFLGEVHFTKVSFSMSFVIWDGILSIVLNFFVMFGSELMFRGYIQKTLNEKYGFYFSLFVSTILFSVVRIYNTFSQINKENLGSVLSSFCVYFSLGVLLCLAIRKTSSLWWSIGFHWGYFLFISFMVNEYFVPNFSNNSLISGGFIRFGGTSFQHHLIYFFYNAFFILLMIIFKKTENKKEIIK